MPSRESVPLVAVLRDFSGAGRLSLRDWDLLIRQGRRAGLLGTIASRLADGGVSDAVPAPVRPHLESARRLSERHAIGVRWEIECIARALRPLSVPIILLKGAAYAAAGLPVARGRTFIDIDVMVPQAALARTETALAVHGWLPGKMTSYDQRYYREWMHEIPPLTHFRRRSALDLHHTILPPTSKPKPDARKLLAAAVPVTEFAEVYVLAPPDMVLHSATHLFYDGELNHGLRDLVDIDGLLQHFAAQDSNFWRALLDRAFEMELAQPLFYGLRYAKRFLGTPVPEFVQEAVARAGPSRAMRPVMDALFDRALMPDHATCSDWFTPTARWLLFVRAHYLRMPLRLLFPHLARKAWRRVKGEETH